MPAGGRPSRTQLWLEGFGDWSWPGRDGGRRGEGVGLPDPPSWVPRFPPGLEPALAAGAAGGSSAAAAVAGSWPAAGGDRAGRPSRAARRGAWRPGLAWLPSAGGLVGALVGAFLLAALGGAGVLERVSGLELIKGPRALAPASAPASVSASERPPRPDSAIPPANQLPPLPHLQLLSHDSAGSSIELTSFPSWSLPGKGSFYVYLPPGYGTTTRRYPVLYMLHGRNGHAISFLEMGLQQDLDQLIDTHAIPPMIVVLIQDRPGLSSWHNVGRRHSETYVVEVQELVDWMLRTIPTRAARAVAGSSMGGFGAMNVALNNPLRFSVVESWLGYFNGLLGVLQTDAPTISRLGLHAFLYGAAEDPVAIPAEDPEFAGMLNADGAQAESAIYPGGHSLQKVKEHLLTGLLFAGRSLKETQARAAAEAHTAH
jgi:enterochelin esterase-like enzyme